MVLCPNGHASSTDDYCDSCGAPVARAPSVEMQTAPTAPESDHSPRACPVCSTEGTDDDVFCEGCGYRFGAPLPVTTAVRINWEIVITTDRSQYDRNGPIDIPFPEDVPPRVVTLEDEEIV